ncbi:hypothetical protein Clacol_006508 [Clathrus columnatus]|uniref:Peptidase M24 domain-containing protein n=1 Tax=Clathrus columnatus TaxID=1419009 RepID=A0AAV5AF31_9AGAM|nr:hypothetical protein Clacol_006508 [Clathrus columnatus]
MPPEKFPVIMGQGNSKNDRILKCSRTTLALVSLAFVLAFYYTNKFDIFRNRSYTKPISFRNYCDSIPPISSEEFHARQNALARELHISNASAYIAEPGANALYFGNISQASWHLSERPLLLIISPTISNATIEAKLTILTPKFEASRARMLNVPGTSVEFIEWAEDEDPYVKALSAFPQGLDNRTIFLSESTRLFVRDGLQSAASATDVLSAPYSIRVLRERKSSTEIALLRCVNEVTLLAIRHVREEIYFGIRQSEVSKMINRVLLEAGLSDPSGLVLFGENAARPHGGPVDKKLTKTDLILFDIGATLHGYTSDVTRTFALEASKIPSRYIAIWDIVKIAQQFALSAATANAVAQDVDKAARDVFRQIGYDVYFTHRLGHALTRYAGKVGIRLEDCFVIQADGRAVYLTEGVGGAARDPWNI